MGHESRIEPWVAVDNRSACGVSDRISFVAKGNENPSEGKPKPGSPSVHRSDADRPEHLQCNYVGLEAKETAPGEMGEVFALDFPVYRTALGRTNRP
jgi:hypothetical protein